MFLQILTNVSGFHAAKVEQVKFNVMELHAYPDMAAKQHLVDDGSGEVKVGSRQFNTKTKTTPLSFIVRLL